MKKLRITLLITLIAVCTRLTNALANPAPLSDPEKQFLARYEKIRASLVVDDLGGAKGAAGELGEEGMQLERSGSLKEARAAFEKLSEKAKQLAAGQSGFYVAHCPMLKKDWVQTNEKIANPYGGKEMVLCGEIKK